MDALEGISHPNIVRFIEHGQAGGKLYLVMEYLDGPTLRAKCDRANRLTLSEAIAVMTALSSALVALHPNQQVVQALRQKGGHEELTATELDELERARHGHVHRDIKPENVILVRGRGPVLIDFNISSEVDAPVRTVQQTPGYLPPDGLPPRWSVDVDLYALGVTMLQATLGIEFDGNNLNDLRELTSAELHKGLADILLRLTAPTSSGRFATARDLERALARIKLS
jgi:serine/threonine protein kinase